MCGHITLLPSTADKNLLDLVRHKTGQVSVHVRVTLSQLTPHSSVLLHRDALSSEACVTCLGDGLNMAFLALDCRVGGRVRILHPKLHPLSLDLCMTFQP